MQQSSQRHFSAATNYRMKRAVEDEKKLTKQRLGRDLAQPMLSYSELRTASPLSYLWRRCLYRVESALESVRNRVYALTIMVIFLLLLSVTLFIGVSWLSEDEYEHMLEDASGGGPGVSHIKVIMYAVWLTWTFFVDPGSHTDSDKLDPFR